MIVLCNLASELQAIIKMFNQNFCFYVIFPFKVGTFLDLTLQNHSLSGSWKSQEILKNFFLGSFVSTYDVSNKKISKKV